MLLCFILFVLCSLSKLLTKCYKCQNALMYASGTLIYCVQILMNYKIKNIVINLFLIFYKIVLVSTCESTRINTLYFHYNFVILFL